MALGRGGDQAVIKDENQFNFFGGKSNEHEKDMLYDVPFCAVPDF